MSDHGNSGSSSEHDDLPDPGTLAGVYARVYEHRHEIPTPRTCTLHVWEDGDHHAELLHTAGMEPGDFEKGHTSPIITRQRVRDDPDTEGVVWERVEEVHTQDGKQVTITDSRRLEDESP